MAEKKQEKKIVRREADTEGHVARRGISKKAVSRRGVVRREADTEGHVVRRGVSKRGVTKR